jgi:thiol-disulfide isomerase/thioredoxin
MKIQLLIILNLFLLRSMTGQPFREQADPDPFCLMVQKIYSLDAVSFRSQFNMKQVFENDTVTTFARVTVKKTGTDISFLEIVPEKENRELLLYNDSAWMVYHDGKKMICLGPTIEYAINSDLAVFFSYTLFSVDTLISHIEPYWKVLKKTKDYTVVSLNVENSSGDLSEIKAEFTIRNVDYLPYSTLQESVYLKADKIFQEQIFTDYVQATPAQTGMPAYFSAYRKDFSLVAEQATFSEDDPASVPLMEYFPETQLFDLVGNQYFLPDSGLIFLDFWYVGCPPCMKSATIIERLYEDYNEELHFYSVNETDSDTAKINRFKDKMGITFPVLRGGNEKVAFRITGNAGYPVFMILDGKTRKILWKFTGYTENLEELIINAIVDHR